MGLLEALPDLVIVISGLNRILFSTIIDKHCLLLAKHELIKSQKTSPISKSLHDISPEKRDKGTSKFSEL